MYGKQYFGEVVPKPSCGKNAKEKELLEAIHRELKKWANVRPRLGS
jgi:hypothetical protein